MRRDERGSTIPLIIGFALVLALVVGFVVDATAAYLRRQALDTLADGAALRGADLGAAGTEVYAGGLGADDLHLTAITAQHAVHAYLVQVGAYRHYPGLTASVTLDAAAQRVQVHLQAPLHLPLRIPGSPAHATVGAEGEASVLVDR
ncbi:pilus assembly protein TadG-related protein [Nocardioides sp. BP30]|uniref:pilus assembly protein TadG-related protein n=1 Tax=Nocardioides sp. BP30 TaxID=3036374 RepID=UPI0024696B21|nr:pilus assembly protein TadG-related protein [Nocardioides sp. BP30]WGL53506.1 pilus assembly protein TadG-related protein [Nocardioides sp. BP30]